MNSNSSAALLSVRNLSVHYGVICALENLSLEVKAGEVVCVLGANGAGKTTLLRALSGLVQVSSGTITYLNENITEVKPHEIVRRGLVHAPEGRGIFPNLTVEENLDLGAWTQPDKIRYAETLESAYTLFPRLRERRRQYAGTLSGGEQQMLAIGRALMAEPKLLLLDEPSLGLAPQIIEKIFEIIIAINKAGKTLLLVEQNAVQALEVAHRGIVLEAGRLALSGTAAELCSSEAVKKAYLGG